MPNNPAEQEFFEDTISLGQYWQALMRYRWLIVGVTVVGLLISLVHYYTRLEAPFPYTAVIQIGSTASGDPIESMSTVAAKIKEGYLPKILAESQDIMGGKSYNISVVVPPQSTLVTLGSYGAKADEENILLLLQKVSDLIISDHDNRLTLLREQLATQNKFATEELANAQAQAKVIENKFKTLDESAAFLQRQIKEKMAYINSAKENRLAVAKSEAARTQNNESLATALLLLDSDIQKEENALASLEEKLNITLKENRDKIERELLDNQQLQSQKQLNIANVKSQIDNLKKSALAVAPTRLLQTRLRPLSQLLLFGAVGGFAAGVFIALFADFIERSKRYKV